MLWRPPSFKRTDILLPYPTLFRSPTGPGMGGGGVPSGLESAQATYTVGASLGYVFPLIVGALAMTGEFRHQTITPTLLYQPLRSTVLFAKLAVNKIGRAHV